MAIKRNIKTVGSSFIALLAVIGGVFAISQANVSAANHTVSPGQSIQLAINAAASGDTIILNAGTYNERLEIIKPITLKGNGSVTINTKESTNLNANDLSVYSYSETFKGVAIYDAANVTIDGITFDGENAGTGLTRQTGIDISGANNAVLTNVTVKNYLKNGIAVTTQFNPARPVGEGVTFNNITVDNAAWAGIAFYTRSSEANDVALKGVTFSGTTTISQTAYGIQFGQSSNTQPIEGVNGAPVALGTVVFVDNAANISQDTPSLASITIATDSTINGLAVTAADFPAQSISLVEPADDEVIIPGVPDTAIGR